MLTVQKQLGLLRSVAIYNWKPFNRRRLRRFYQAFVQPGDLCFDVGAHVGNRTQAWLDLGARVVSVEPQPICVHFLERKFGHAPNWQLEPKAVGAYSGHASMLISSRAPTISTLSTSWVEEIRALEADATWDDVALVEVVTLDDLIATYGLPQFCKIDVEDYEEQALQGLSQPIPALSFEFFPTTLDKSVACMERLRTLGDYAFNWSVGETMRLSSEQWLTLEALRDLLMTYDEPRSGDVYARLRS